MPRLVLRPALAGLVAVAVIAPAASAAAPAALAPVQQALTAAPKACATTTYVAPMSGYVTVRGTAADTSDWDLVVRDKASNRQLAASRGFGSHEVAQTWVGSGQKLALQGCRRAGRASRFGLATTLVDVAPPKADGTPQLLEVSYRSNRDLERIEQTGLDLTHDIHDGKAAVIATGAKQLAQLKGLGLSYDVVSKDMTADYARARKADAASTKMGPSPLPSGRTEYRTYDDYQTEIKALATTHPGLTKPVTLPQKSFQGREIQGLEISKGVDDKTDGKPVFVLVGMHHAREWPSAESALEFAYLLVNGAGKDPRVDAILAKERVVIVPILNVDGFVESRGATDPADTLGEPLLQTVEGVALLGGSFAYRRKNCDGAIPDGSVPCTLQYGIDPNRNYGNGWGGQGAGSDPITQSYRGTGPWSEPETQAFHEYTQRRQVSNVISLHNVAALVLRPPGTHTDGKAPDEDGLRALGDAMAKATGYTSQYSFQLYDTSGTTEDWNYAAAGSYGYTIEIGPPGGEFHMAYQKGVVDEWTGTRARRTEGKGLREALLLGAEKAGDPAIYSTLTGSATPGRTLRVRKEFDTMTGAVCTYAQGYVQNQDDNPIDCLAPGEPQAIPDFLDYTTVVPASGTFTWAVTPSTRPFVGSKYEDGKGLVSTGKKEQWTLTCEDGAGKVLATTKVTVDRGETATVTPGC